MGFWGSSGSLLGSPTIGSHAGPASRPLRPAVLPIGQTKGSQLRPHRQWGFEAEQGQVPSAPHGHEGSMQGQAGAAATVACRGHSQP